MTTSPRVPLPPPPSYAPTVGLVTTWWTPGDQPGPTPLAASADCPQPEAQPEPEPEPDENDEPTDDGRQQPEQVDWRAFADRVGAMIAETPEERAERQRAEREAAFLAARETPEQRNARYRAEERDRRRRASALWRVAHGERVRRFRRWCLLTFVSASVGYGLHLVQAASHLPVPVTAAVCAGCWVLDLWIRGDVRVSEVAGVRAVALLIVVRVPVASALVALLGLTPLLALTTHI